MKTSTLAIAATLVLASFVACGGDASEDRDAGNGNAVEAGAEGCAQGVEVESESGLRIEDVRCGDGAEAEGDSAVVVHYVGTLEDGTKFDSSRDKGEPAEFTLGVNQLMPGFEEGIRGMREGGIRRLTIPPELGHGAQGLGPIPPDSTVTFEVELISVSEAPSMG